MIKTVIDIAVIHGKAKLSVLKYFDAGESVGQQSNPKYYELNPE